MVLPGPLPRRPYVRLLAATDGSPIGKMGLEYLKSLLRCAPVRLYSVTGSLSGGWERYSTLLGTPIAGGFVNVVCCGQDRWTWVQHVQMPNKDGTFTPASERQELYTAGVRNVLLTDSTPKAPGVAQCAVKYEAIVVPSLDLAAVWEEFGCHASVIPVPVLNHHRVKELVMPT
jgi:hypothetical protein